MGLSDNRTPLFVCVFAAMDASRIVIDDPAVVPALEAVRNGEHTWYEKGCGVCVCGGLLGERGDGDDRGLCDGVWCGEVR